MKKFLLFLSLICVTFVTMMATAATATSNSGNEAASDVTVDFKLPSSVAAITNNMVVANVTVDRAYYAIYWHIRCATDPDFYYGGSLSASNGQGTYTVIASTPSAQPVELNSGNVYTFTFETCEFGWDAPALIATFEVTGAGAAAERFSDITVTNFDGTLGALGYLFKKKYNITFSAPVTDVKAFTPLGLDGTGNFTVTAADTQGLKWTIDVSSMAGEEGAFELHVQARDAATGLRLRGNFNLDNSFIYTICVSTSDPGTGGGGNDPELPSEEVEVATITIGGTVYKLSEQEAIELASYPAGAVFTITLADEAIKKVTYEIIDHTTNEVLKSVADLNKGEEGKWTAEMPRTYDLAAGHVYYVHIVARDGMSSFTSNVLHEYNFLVNGINSDVAVYSTVKVASIDPSEDTLITEDTPVITITFTEAIASLSVTAVIGQMSSIAIPAANITTSDNIAWSVAVPAGTISGGALSLNFVAIDNEGHRVTDANNGVGTPDNCYINYGWASTANLPTPSLLEDGDTLEVLEALHFTYDGIGLNQDNSIATWNQISIARDGVDLGLTITESMFAVSGDESVGGTVLQLTLAEALTEAGVYTIHVPARAFVLGHENENFFNGECTFTVTVSGTSDQNVVVLHEGDNYLTQYQPVSATFTPAEDCKVLIEADDQFEVKYGGQSYFFTYVPTNSPANSCEIDNVTGGTKITLSSPFVMNSHVRITTFAKGEVIPLEVKTVLPAVGSSDFWNNSGLLEIAFNRRVTLSGAQMLVGQDKYDVEILHVTSSISINVGTRLNELLKNGTLNPGDSFHVALTGVRDAEDSNNLYNGTGNLDLTYTAPCPQYALLSATVAGQPLTTQSLNDYTFLSYYSPEGDDGLFVLDFESDIQSVSSVVLQMGSRDLDAQGKYYEGTLPYSIEGHQLIIDARGTLRTLSVLFPAVIEGEADEEAGGEGHGDYDREHITMRISNVKDTNGNVFVAQQAGNVGSYSFYMNYRELRENINLDGDNKMAGDEVQAGEQISLWLSSADVTFDAIAVTYLALVDEDAYEPRTVLQTQYSVEADPYQGVIITFILPAMPDVAAGQVVHVALHNASSPDGMPHDLSIDFKAGEPSAIEAVQADAAHHHNRTYTLQGLPLKGSLPAGVPCIVDNKILFITK